MPNNQWTHIALVVPRCRRGGLPRPPLPESPGRPRRHESRYAPTPRQRPSCRRGGLAAARLPSPSSFPSCLGTIVGLASGRERSCLDPVANRAGGRLPSVVGRTSGRGTRHVAVRRRKRPPLRRERARRRGSRRRHERGILDAVANRAGAGGRKARPYGAKGARSQGRILPGTIRKRGCGKGVRPLWWAAYQAGLRRRSFAARCVHS